MKIDEKTLESVKEKVDNIGIMKVCKGTGLSFGTVRTICEKGVCTSTTFSKLATFLTEEQNKINKLIQELED